ncbi:hypothetical protein [Lactobacillus phage JCL1032]|uniref:hypothetical protein n=1 Tax=Lactobacillus phage JCL1032 TaxID=37105 RepID=UPI000217A9E6|nr:hypothetical protein F367_gp21 [Lactobacillus phage JCL1032]ACB72544.1 hypothetical protein [Lactobacillus phage JCL1032]
MSVQSCGHQTGTLCNIPACLAHKKIMLVQKRPGNKKIKRSHETKLRQTKQVKMVYL